MATLASIINIAENLGETADSLKKNLDAMERQINGIRMEFLKKLMPISQRYGQLKADLERAVEENPQHFVKPRTIEVNGVKFGMQSKSGKVTFDNADAVIEKVKLLLSTRKNVLIQTKETLNVRGLYVISEMERKAIGVGKLPDNPNAVVVQIKAVDEAHSVVQKMIEDFRAPEKKKDLKMAS
ncbi:MAG TPA: hypothetical protein P5044_07590 [bacterium]|nr:hypothetical protein [bacterium]